MARARAAVSEIESIYRSRYRDLLRLATAIVGDEAAAHDAVQDAFAQALKQRASFRGDGPLEAWIWRIVVNAARGARRQQAARHKEPEHAEATSSTNGDGDDDFGVRAWVAALPERQRVAVYLRYYADLDYRAIATALEIEVGTVSATLSTAHAALRRSLEEVRR